MGAGKTTVMGEVSDLLLARGIQHAAIDLDMVQTPLLAGEHSNQVAVKNMTALIQNCRDAGIDRFVVAWQRKTSVSPTTIGRSQPSRRSS